MDEKTEKTVEKTEKKTPKLRATIYKNNPFMDEKYPLVQVKTKRITNNKGGYLVKSDDGQVVSQIAGFWHAEEVDSTKFVKLYVNGVKAFSGLTSKGTKVFELMYHEIQRNQGKDKISLRFGSIDQNVTKISKSTFYDGLNELVEKKFLAPTDAPNVYWVNPDYVWNGDRLSFVKTYVRNAEKSIPKRDTNTLDMFPPDETTPSE